MRLRWTMVMAVAALGVTASTAMADGPKDNIPKAVRRIPALGINVSAEDRKVLESELAALEQAVAELEGRRDSRTRELLPDVQVFHKAVQDALKYQEFFAAREVTKAKVLLRAGRERAEQLRGGSAPWTTQTGLVVRGYRSKIDGSVQPYGLVIPPGVSGPSSSPTRLDVWFHGRGETLSEVNFLDEHSRQPGQFTPPDTIVLHPYGRYCNAFKFAGEVDVLEAIDAVKRNYRIDEDRISVRGFSMGGAAAWQFAVHYPDRWFAANPGAGFSETPRFLRVFQDESLKPSWYEKTLWLLYDCDKVAANLIACPTVAYSGEIDRQKQAADVMAEALKAEGIDLLHIIGPKTAHAYHPDSKREVERRMNSLADRGRQRYPAEVTLVTYTLKYNQMHWLTIDRLGEHWKRARVHAAVAGKGVAAETENVDALTLEFPAGWSPFPLTRPVEITIDSSKLEGPRPQSDRSWSVRLRRTSGGWVVASNENEDHRLAKRHDLQGPIDDAFMDSFVFVKPSGKGSNPRVDAWAEQEGNRAVEHWRRQFRGEARVKADTAVSDADIASSNLVLWGDPESNSVLKRIADRLPISWTGARIKAGEREFPAASHALILVYPNPLNPTRYVVLNSGFTFRDYDYLNNARQVPKLPDWAVIDLDTPPDSQKPGGIAAADFFDESWGLRKPNGEH